VPNKARSSSATKQKAVILRHAPTLAELKLWHYLQRGQVGGYKFRRQHAIRPFIADFCCVPKRMVIEVDGGQHVDQAEYDADRTRFLENLGYRVLRFWNNDVEQNIDGVVEVIRQALEEGPPQSHSPR